MADADDEILVEGLRASDMEVAVPPDFADRVLAARVPPARRRRGRVVGWTALAMAAALLLAFGWTRRRVHGALEVSDSASLSTVLLARRARMVVEPGTHVSWDVGGILPGGVDRVEIARGAAFFRVDRGAEFEVHTSYGTVVVTGTCFRVAVEGAQGDAQMNAGLRARWFGAGVVATALAVTVYEGGVRVASARSHESLQLAPGETASVAHDGSLARGPDRSATAALAATQGAQQTAAAAGSAYETAARAQAELERLRALLAANGISAETGRPLNQPAPGTPASDALTHPHLADNSDTNLTPEEWRILAERGELRFRLPGAGGRGTPMDARHGTQLGIPESEFADINAVIQRDRDRLLSQEQALYREASGADPGNLSLDALQNEIRDKTPDETVAQVDAQLAYERAGLASAPPTRADASPYERMMRLLIGYEGQVEQDLVPVVGQGSAHELIMGTHHLSGWSFGRSFPHSVTPAN